MEVSSLKCNVACVLPPLPADAYYAQACIRAAAACSLGGQLLNAATPPTSSCVCADNTGTTGDAQLGTGTGGSVSTSSLRSAGRSMLAAWGTGMGRRLDGMLPLG